MRNTENYVTSSNNLQKNTFYDLTWNFGQLQKHVQHSRFSLLDRYILSPHLLISWHTYGHHICLFHYTYKCNFLTWTTNNTSKYILVSKKTTIMCTLCIATSLGVNGPWRNNIRNILKLMLHLAITYSKRTYMMEFENFGQLSKNL